MPLKTKKLFSVFNFKTLAGGLFLALSIYGCNILTAATQPAIIEDIMWYETQSPLLPTTWPPSSDTVWVRYTFAYGSNPAHLMDGNYVSNPLSKTEWKAGIESTTVLSEEKTQAATQGVVPLDEQAQKILQNEGRISEFALKLTEMPNAQAPEIKEFLAYYRTWFKYNGAFLGLIRSTHGAFIEWVTQDD